MTTAHDVRLFEKRDVQRMEKEKNTRSVRVFEAFDATRSQKHFNHGPITQ